MRGHCVARRSRLNSIADKKIHLPGTRVINYRAISQSVGITRRVGDIGNGGAVGGPNPNQVTIALVLGSGINRIIEIGRTDRNIKVPLNKSRSCRTPWYWSRRRCRGTRRAESRHLHNPWARTDEGRAGAVGTGGRDNLIFRYVTVRGEQSLGEP